MHDRAAAVHRSAPVLRGSYRRCAASSHSWAPGSITGTAGVGLALPWAQPFCMEEDEVSMSSAAGWGRRVSSAGPYVGRILLVDGLVTR